jgi:hypothetical protein
MDEAEALCDEVLTWLAASYRSWLFYCERDVVWTVQQQFITTIGARHLPYHVSNDYPMLPGNRRSLSADLALVGTTGVVAAIEFKYEPSHRRDDILPGKFPVVAWPDVVRDTERLPQFFAAHPSLYVAYAIFIDEGGSFCHRPPPPHSAWRHWQHGQHVLLTRIHRHV